MTLSIISQKRGLVANRRIAKRMRTVARFLFVLGAWSFRLAQSTDSAAAELDNLAQESNCLRIGIAPGTWQGLNRNDATAAMGAWAKTILKQRGTSLKVDTILFESSEELAKALQESRIDCASMLTDQFFLLDRALQPEEVFVAVNNGSSTDRYVLLARQDSGISEVAQLQGKKLAIQSSARTGLAMPWLDMLLADHTLGTPAELLAAVIETDKPSKAVLPVFFHQMDACLVTSNAFAVAGELNPQLRQELKILATSPEVVPAVFFFRRNYISNNRTQLEPAILELHQSPAGLQVMTVFQCERMIKCPLVELQATHELLLKRVQARQTPAQGEVSLDVGRRFHE